MIGRQYIPILPPNVYVQQSKHRTTRERLLAAIFCAERSFVSVGRITGDTSIFRYPFSSRQIFTFWDSDMRLARIFLS